MGDILSYINPFSENFILNGVLNFLSNIISYINPWHDNFLGKKIVELIGDLLQWLFIPKDDYFQSKFDVLKNDLSNRLSYQSYIDIFEQTKSVVNDEQLSISINNYNIGNGIVINKNKFIDFEWFEPYKSTYYGWIRGVTFIFLVIFNINQVYKLIRGTSILDGFKNGSAKGGEG